MRPPFHFCPSERPFLSASFFTNLPTQITVHASSRPFMGLVWEGFAMADMPKVVTARVAARYVGLSEVVYRPADLDQWLESRTARDTSDADARFLKALTMAHPR